MVLDIFTILETLAQIGYKNGLKAFDGKPDKIFGCHIKCIHKLINFKTSVLGNGKRTFKKYRRYLEIALNEFNNKETYNS